MCRGHLARACRGHLGREYKANSRARCPRYSRAGGPRHVPNGLLAVALLAAAGCSNSEPMGVNYYRASDAEIARVSRVVFVDLSEDVGYPEIADRMSRALEEALLQRGMFRVDVIPKNHPDLRYLDMTKRDPYTVRELAAIRKSLRCDAILFGKMIRYQPYPGTQIGLYMRLVDLKNGRLLWAVDDAWDTTNRKTYQQIQNFYIDRMRETYDPAKSEMGIMSTDGFQKFVAYQVTLSMDPDGHGETKTRRYLIRPAQRLGRHTKQVTKDTIEDF
ncbi:MAG: hypothetical protein JW849_03885 [Phycisphaerae bacterium]|nr:hypothetical protein [Phycisphaerae bacterium]